MSLIEHRFLIQEKDYNRACQRITRFLERYELLSYDRLKFEARDSLPAFHPRFWKALQEAQERNRQVIRDLFRDLAREGYRELFDLALLPQGYLSKIFHTLAHLLDGFLGIDSYFYNLEEDSHWVSRRLERKIQTQPEGFWLVKLYGYTEVSEPRFELLKPPSRQLKNAD